MKSLVPWVCLIAVTVNQQSFADNNFSDYRLGHYDKAVGSLINQQGKNPIADYYLGRMYLYGYGQLKNTKLALKYFNQSAQKGYLPAIQLMARYSLLQKNDLSQASVWFKKAAAAGDVDAQLYMAAAYLYGLGEKKNKDSARKYYIDAAKNGSSVAQYTLAKNFLLHGNASSTKLGLIWLNKSAANQNPKALTLLASFYINGKWVEKNLEKARALLNDAIALNYGPAMVKMGQLALEQNKKEDALSWFTRAGNTRDNNAYLDLAEAYLQKESPIYNQQTAFMWVLKAAQNDSIKAKKQLAELYKKGIGVEANPELAKQWFEQSSNDEKTSDQSKIKANAALWLSNGHTDKFESSVYQMQGILTNWQNKDAKADLVYNQAPILQRITRQSIFKPSFELIAPNQISIMQYYEALLSGNEAVASNQWSYPKYPLNKQVADLENITSLVIAHDEVPVPHINASYNKEEVAYNSFDQWAEGGLKKLSYLSVFYNIYHRAILGDAQAQFEIGQMFQYGIGVAQNNDSAMIFYQNAVQQQHLGAEYNLAIMHLLHAKNAADYQTALNDLTDAAFKGNKNSQYVLARILEKGITAADGVQYVKANPEQALSMLYLAAASGYGPAEYELANHLAKQVDKSLSIEAKEQKISLLRGLYQDAANRGVSNALLPLAYFNAMSPDKIKLQQAFMTASTEASKGDKQAALLLGLMYDRGLGTERDFDQALNWYRQAGENAVVQFITGTYHALGKGSEKNVEQGMTELQFAATDNFSYADFNLAVLLHQTHQDFLPDLNRAYELGNSHAGIVLADYYLSESKDAEKMKQSRYIYESLAAKGDQNAQLKLGFMNEKGLGSIPDLAEAERWYTASAEQGNKTAEFLLGQFYQEGLQNNPDYKSALNWYEKSANTISEASVAKGFIQETVEDNYSEALKSYQQAVEAGNPYAAYNLALMYLYGKGMPVDFEKAQKLLTTAADKGIPAAMYQLGELYFNGQYGPRNEPKALEWFTKAAELADANALYELGLFAETGVGSAINANQAVNFYKQAALKGNEKASLALARMYQYGIGIEKDSKEALQIYTKLAEKNNAYAQYQLGVFYIDGIAGETSFAKGKNLLLQASENGSSEAQLMLQRIEAKSQPQLSFIEPIVSNQIPIAAGEASLMYLNALNEWNRGDELLSRKILQHLITQHPDYSPAKEVYEQLKQAKVANN